MAQAASRKHQITSQNHGNKSNTEALGSDQLVEKRREE